jgi:hypothetical protein
MVGLPWAGSSLEEAAMQNRDPSVSPDLDREADAWNAAFHELELDCHWNRSIASELAAIPDETARIAAYLRVHRPHLLKSYPLEFLAEAISGTKARLRAAR